MPTVVRRSSVNVFDARREILHAVSWQVQSSIWSPPTDVYETNDAYAVRVEVAGMREDDFEVAVENNVLMVSGSRQDIPGRRAYHQMEIRFGKFAAAIGLPGPVDVDLAVAQYADGFLTITLPKSKPNQIKVK
jgi:HSP20 family protein